MTFELVNHKVLRAAVAPGAEIVARRGAMLAYHGDVRFTPATIGGGFGAGRPGMGGLTGMAGRAMAGESSPLMAATGSGEVFYGHLGAQVTIVEMDGSGELSVEADRLLAFPATMQTAVVFLGTQGGVRGAIRGAVTGQGLFTTAVSGVGQVAVLSHGGTLALTVGGGRVLTVDPQAYVGHVGALTVTATVNAGWREAVGRGSGEAVQLKISGDGTVYVQASEQKL
ncbi:MAG TPA: AIM24 family protein [Kineosporiaceae bacterium]|nr:AIM24 family protein [Kineosporiaceae bacterium]